MDFVERNKTYLNSLPVKQSIDLSVLKQFPNSQIPRREQEEIFHFLNGPIYAQMAADPRNRSYDIWAALAVRAIDPKSFPAKYLNQRISQVEYLFRHDPRTQWNWREEMPLTPLIKKIVAPYEKLFSFFSRVKIHIQRLNHTVHFHRDLTAGLEYQIINSLTTEWADTKPIAYQMYPWVDLNDLPPNSHESDPLLRNAFALKIPLSENPENYGLQTIVDGRPYYYTTQGNAYLLNENCYHGTQAVPFYRGLIFVDGIINPQALKEMKIEPVLSRPYSIQLK